ncbi:MAG: arsenite methyltransferase [Acidimicrobiia bacterium]
MWESSVRSDDILIREEVRRRYADSALGLREDCCDVTGGTYSSDDLSVVPEGAALASLGCGNPTAVAELREGETVLDLGSGGGIDVILSAKRVGSTGFAYGLDMTDEMIELARRNATDANVANVDFLKGLIEEIPLDDESVDVVISNCVINLSVDKQAVFQEMYRVLRPGGRLGITDIVADDSLTREERMERGSWVGCIAGALSVSEYGAGLAAAGFTEIAQQPTHDVAEGMASMIIRARRPAA